MKRSFLFLLAIVFTLNASSQIFKHDEAVEVDPLLSDTIEGKWRQATVVDFDSIASTYTVKLIDGNKMVVPSKTPEQWIRPFVNKQELNKYGPAAKLAYERRSNAMKNIKCNGSEAAVKRNIKSQMATYFTDYPYIFVDFTSFKGQNGYESKKYPGQQVYPYKIEMLVHLRRSMVFGGREYTEYQTWIFDREYEYVALKGRKCEFYATKTSDMKMVSKGWY